MDCIYSRTMGRRYFGEHQGLRHEKTALLVGLLVPPSAQVFFLKSANQRGKRHYHGAAFDDLPTMSVR